MQGIALGFYESHRRTWFVTACLLSILSVQPAAAWQFREVTADSTDERGAPSATPEPLDHPVVTPVGDIASPPDQGLAEPTEVQALRPESTAPTSSEEKTDIPAGPEAATPQTTELPTAAVASEPTPAPPHQAPLPKPEPVSSRGVKGEPGTVVITETYTEKVLEVPEDPNSIEPLCFRGVVPGKTKITELPDDWGEPFKIYNGKEGAVGSIYKYRLKPFRQVDVANDGDTVTTLLIHLNESQDPVHLASELFLNQLDPVPVPDEFGEVLGIAFPERGVLMTFDGEVEGELVRKIQLEPITPEPFLLRAEYDFKGQFSRDLEDLEKALKLNPKYAQAHWLKALILKEIGRMHDALDSARRAVRYHPQHVLYRLTGAELAGLNGDYDMAIGETRRILDHAELTPLERARGECQLGDLLARGPEGQYQEAIEHHQKAIELAAPLANERRFRPRRMAKQVLMDAHLGMARNIAHGEYQQQKVTVRKWVDRAMALVDEAIRRDQGDEAMRLDVYLRALQVHGDLKHTGNPEALTERALRDARRMISEATDNSNKSRLEWKLATILAEAVRIQRLRGDHETALQRANDAMALFKQSAITRQSTPEQKYAVGTLYFRVGSLYAVQRDDHREAVEWYERARPMLNGQLPMSVLAEADVHGERFVSMGVSYWEQGNRDMAIELTERGVEVIQAAVDKGSVHDGILAVPYSNLATMHGKAGNNDDAKAFAKLAAQVQEESKLR